MSAGSGRAVRVAVCCSVLQCVAVCYSVLQCVVMRCDVSFSHPAAFCVCRTSSLTVVRLCVLQCCSVLQCVAVCCRVLQCVAECCSIVVCCSVLRCVAVCHSVIPWPFAFIEHFHSQWRDFASCLLQCVAVCCSMLQYVAVCCSVLQCVAVRCSVLQCVAMCCSVLQCVAVCCSVLQCVAVCCSVLQCVVLSSGGHTHMCGTGWQRPPGSLIFMSHFPKKSPVIGGSFAERDLQLKALYATSPRYVPVHRTLCKPA